MEFWPENQGQSPLYTKFGTVPGRHCTHNYHDRHQETHYPLYYGEQQDPSRESNYWTVPGSRTGRAPQEYSNWTEQEMMTGPASSSHFPFILDHHSRQHQHQDMGEYHHPPEARDRERTAAAQHAAREYERGFLREGWQSRWEQCNAVRYNREVSTKRSDSSYRELEAWAARYSHSLPRRRRIEAELRGASSQGLLESSRAPERDSREGTDPRVAALQQALQSANIRESALMMDRASRQKSPNYYPSQTPTTTDPSHMPDMKEKSGYQRRMFSQPPGYTAPPPYNSPHKNSPVFPHCDTSWEQEGKRQTYWSQPPLRRQDVSVALREQSKSDKEDFAKPDGNQYKFPEFEGLKHQRQGTDASQTSNPTSIQKTHIQHEAKLALQWPQVLQAVQNKKIQEESSSKVIEGRKFRLNKKTGGMTIFCLVSRIAGTAGTPSLPLCTSQTKFQNTELGAVSKGLRNEGDTRLTQKLADEVDFTAPILTEQSNSSEVRNLKAQLTETPNLVESELFEDITSSKAEQVNADNTDSAFGIQIAQSVQPVSVKYPLWREPSFTTRAETESSPTHLRANSQENESDADNQEEDPATVHRLDVEVGRPKDTECKDSEDLLVIDTTCVVVKMELIPPPEKAHVHYVDTEDSPCDNQSIASPEHLTQPGLEVDQNTEADSLHIDEGPNTNSDPDLMEEKTPEGENYLSFPCMSTISNYERETLEERAERILGIPLQDSIAEHKPEDPTSLLDSLEQEIEPSLMEDNRIDDADDQNLLDSTEDKQSQDQLEVDQTEEAVSLQMNDNAEDQVTNEDGEEFASGPQEPYVSEENYIQTQTKAEIKASPEIKLTDSPLVPNPSLSFTPSSPDLTSVLDISESNKKENLDPGWNSTENLSPYPETCPLPHPPSPQTPSLSPLASTDFSTSSTSNGLPPLVLTDHTEESLCIGIKEQDEGGETSQEIKSEIDDPLEDLAEDVTEVSVLQQQLRMEQSNVPASITESNGTDEQPTEETNKHRTEHIMDGTLKIAEENTTEVILQKRPDCVQSEDISCEIVSYVTEEQKPKEVNEDAVDRIAEQTIHISQENAIEVNGSHLGSCMTEEQQPQQFKEDPEGLSEQLITQENVTDCQTPKEVNILQESFDTGREDASCLKEICTTEEQSQEGEFEDDSVLEQTVSIENATDSQIQVGIKTSQDIESLTELSYSCLASLSESNCKVFQSPLDVLSQSKASSPPDAPRKSDSVCPSVLNHDTSHASGIPEADPAPLDLDPCGGPLQFSSSSSDSAPVLLPSSSTPLLLDSTGGVSDSLVPKEEPQYPKSLWDAVNRIRKHTAPDSENEEEEMIEPWDPESIGEKLGRADVMEEMKYDQILFGQQEVSTIATVEYVGPSEHAEDDTLSCSSTSSHGSGDTIIEADEVDDDAGVESKEEENEDLQAAEMEQCCSGEVKEKTAAKEDKGVEDEIITNKSSQSEECMVGAANTITVPGEMTEAELKESEE